MNSRERVIEAINHRQPDRPPVDLGATGQTGISASALFNLRKHLGLSEKPIEISETLQMLGTVDPDMLELFGVDAVGLNMPIDLFGNFKDNSYQDFKMCDGTPVCLPHSAHIEKDAQGNTLIYPCGDSSVEPSGKMPSTGYFFDNIDRSGSFDEDNLTPEEDFAESFGLLDDKVLEILKKRSEYLFNETQYAIVGNLGGGGLGDSAIVPGPSEKSPKGIRRFEDWLMAHLLYPDYIKRVFRIQTDFMIKNLKLYHQAVGSRVQSVFISGTDFGTQNAGFFTKEVFKELYKPFYKEINDWVHKNTEWKTHYHSCGSIMEYLDDFVDMGVDILNPVQLSAKNMDAQTLKTKYAGKLVFWGGAVDTQSTLPFGSVEDVKKQAQERIEILNNNGGFVFATIHNILANTPPENIVALYETVKCNR